MSNNKINKILHELYINSEPLETFILEMANISKNKTGLSRGVIFISGEVKNHKLPRVNYYPDGTGINKPQILAGKTNTLNDIGSKQLKQVFKWVSINHLKLLDYWKNSNDILIDEFLDSLEKI